MAVAPRSSTVAAANGGGGSSGTAQGTAAAAHVVADAAAEAALSAPAAAAPVTTVAGGLLRSPVTLPLPLTAASSLPQALPVAAGSAEPRAALLSGATPVVFVPAARHATAAAAAAVGDDDEADRAALDALAVVREVMRSQRARRAQPRRFVPRGDSESDANPDTADANTDAVPLSSDGSILLGGPVAEGAGVFARTSRALAAQAALQADMLRGVPGSRQRYVGWKITSHTSGMGLGNRVIGVVSALALAMATQRAFVIVDDSIVATALEAAPLTAGGIDTSADAARAAAAAAGAAWSERHFVWALGADETCGCLDFPSSDATMLTVETTQYAVPCLAHNPHLRAFFAEAFGPALGVFRPLLQRFFRLRPSLQAELDRFDREVMHPPPTASAAGARARRRHVVGLQVRTQHLVRARSEEAVFYRCAEQLGALARTGAAAVARSVAGGAAPDFALQPSKAFPQRWRRQQRGQRAKAAAPALAAGSGAALHAAPLWAAPEPDAAEDAVDAAVDSALGWIETMLRGGNAASPSAGGEGTAGTGPAPRTLLELAPAGAEGEGDASVDADVDADADTEEVDIYYFLASDSPDVRARAAARFGDRLLTWSAPPGGDALPEGAAAVIDTWLLSRCDDVVLTYPKSTFGFIGAALSRTGLPPHAVFSGAKRANECARLTSLEPVFHGWFMRWMLSCYDRQKWETPHMLNQENAYHCVMAPGRSVRQGGGPDDPYTWDVQRCPATDASDSYLFLSSPFEHEATLELGPGEAYYGDLDAGGGAARAKLLERFAPHYQRWLARVGPPAY